MTGVIDVGGGMRAAYGAGVFDWCMDNNIHFDYCVGVSAGSANLVSYLAGQRGRNYVYYTDYNLRDESISFKNFAKTRNFVNLEYIYGELSNQGGEYPLDFSAVNLNPAEFKVVATNAVTGKPYYFDKTDLHQDDYGAIKASSCVPAANRPYEVNGIPFYDGGISDPIPLEKCFEAGCDKVVIVLTRPRDYVRKRAKDEAVAKLIRRKYPRAARVMSRRFMKYNTELQLAKQYEKKGKVLIVAPDDIGAMKTLTRDKEAIALLYHKGYEDAEVIKSFIN
jgi:predicted patatin/cPLA2 family phospholipase